MRPAKIQISLRECAGWSESLLGLDAEGTFSAVEAPLVVLRRADTK